MAEPRAWERGAAAEPRGSCLASRGIFRGGAPVGPYAEPKINEGEASEDAAGPPPSTEARAHLMEPSPPDVGEPHPSERPSEQAPPDSAEDGGGGDEPAGTSVE